TLEWGLVCAAHNLRKWAYTIDPHRKKTRSIQIKNIIHMMENEKRELFSKGHFTDLLRQLRVEKISPLSIQIHFRETLPPLHYTKFLMVPFFLF
ncbi:hypothetical protein ACT3HK_07780, partial [Thermolongibacillus altinsuensis]